MQGWRKVAEPAVRFKGVDLGHRSVITVSAGMPCEYLAIASVDYDSDPKAYVVWFEDIGEVRLPWLGSNPDAIDATVHNNRFKIAVCNYRGDALPRSLVIYDTGYEFRTDWPD